MRPKTAAQRTKKYMFGDNPIRLPEKGDGTLLQVQSIFPTLQGEGPYAGWPAVFIRLGGCNLACDFCDTEFESFTEQPLESLIDTIRQLAQDDSGQRCRHLVVITGGEPLRQNIIPLCEQLLKEGLMVQVETNGTLWRELPESVDIICSPKHTGNGYAPLRADVLERATALKFIISATHDGYTDIADVGQSRTATPVYVQPMDEYDEEKNAANLAHATRLAMAHGYRLSLQLHKIVGIE